MNGDGIADLAVANEGGDRVGVLLGDGDGTFQQVATYSSGGTFPTSVAIADVNGDGKPDLLASQFATTVAGLSVNRDLRQLLWHRHRMVQARTRFMNQLQAGVLSMKGCAARSGCGGKPGGNNWSPSGWLPGRAGDDAICWSCWID